MIGPAGFMAGPKAPRQTLPPPEPSQLGKACDWCLRDIRRSRTKVGHAGMYCFCSTDCKKAALPSLPEHAF